VDDDVNDVDDVDDEEDDDDVALWSPTAGVMSPSVTSNCTTLST